MLSSNACVSALIEKYSSTFSSPSSVLVRKDARRDTGLLDAFARRKPHPCAEKKKKKWTRRRGKTSDRNHQPFSQSGVRSPTARARGVVSMEEDFRKIKSFPKRFDAFLRHFCKKHAKKVALSWRKRRKRRDFYPVLRRFFCCFFFFCCVFQFKEKKIFLEREREDLNAVIMMERT